MKYLFLLLLVIHVPAFSYAGPLHEAARAGDIKEVHRLLASGADPSEIDFLAGSPMHIAALRGYVEIIETLADAGGDIEAVEFGGGMTPLHWAALGGQAQAARTLISLGAVIDARTDRGDTPLLIALENKQIEAGSALVEAGADIHAKTDVLVSPIELAAKAGAWTLVERMAQMGAMPKPPDPVSELIADADLARGEELWNSNCGLCHGPRSRATAKDGHKGPPLANIIGRDVASTEGFPFSEVLLREPGEWTYEKLGTFITDAGSYWPGTSMTNRIAELEMRVLEVSDRAAIIAFIRDGMDPIPPLPD